VGFGVVVAMVDFIAVIKLVENWLGDVPEVIWLVIWF